MSKTIDPYKLELIFRIYNPPYSDNVKRWMDEGDIVSFSFNKSRGENVEFKINGRNDWLIWFSQLYTQFYSGDLENPQICSFKLRNGNYVFPHELPYNRFWDAIKGRRFKVTIDPKPCFCVNKQSKKFQALPFETINEVYKHVHEKILAGDIDSVETVLRPARCYDLVEV